MLLAVLAVIVVGYNLGANSLHNWDEAKYAVVAREMVSSGEWLNPSFAGRPYLNKPPLRIWLTALSFKLGGVSELTARLWSALAAMGTVLGLYLLGRRLFGPAVALTSAFILLTSHQYIYNHCARSGEMDSLLIFFWTNGLLLLQLALERRDAKLLYLACACFGLCGMVKHLTFVPVVLLIAGLIVLADGACRAFRPRIWLTALALVALVALPWHLAQWWIHGNSFLRNYFVTEVIDSRIALKLRDPLVRRWGNWSSLVTIARGFYPWSCLLPLALVDLLMARGRRRRWMPTAIWLLVAVAITVVSGSKFPWYVLPAFPPAAILVARLVVRFLTDHRYTFASLAVLLGGLVALGSISDAHTHNPFAVRALHQMIGVHFLARLRPPGSSPAVGLLVLAVLFAALIGSVLLLRRHRSHERAERWLRRVLVGAIASVALFSVLVPLRFSDSRSKLARMASAIDANLQEDETLVVALPSRKIRNPPFRFYIGAYDYQRMAAAPWPTELGGTLLLTDRSTLAGPSSGERVGHHFELPILAEAGDLLLIRRAGLDRRGL